MLSDSLGDCIRFNLFYEYFINKLFGDILEDAELPS